MTHPVARQIERSAWERMKCRTARQLSDPAWLGGAHRIAERLPEDHAAASTDPWEDARFCAHYIWGAGES